MSVNISFTPAATFVCVSLIPWQADCIFRGRCFWSCSAGERGRAVERRGGGLLSEEKVIGPQAMAGTKRECERGNNSRPPLPLAVSHLWFSADLIKINVWQTCHLMKEALGKHGRHDEPVICLHECQQETGQRSQSRASLSLSSSLTVSSAVQLIVLLYIKIRHIHVFGCFLSKFPEPDPNMPHIKKKKKRVLMQNNV